MHAGRCSCHMPLCPRLRPLHDWPVELHCTKHCTGRRPNATPYALAYKSSSSRASTSSECASWTNVPSSRSKTRNCRRLAVQPLPLAWLRVRVRVRVRVRGSLCSLYHSCDYSPGGHCSHAATSARLARWPTTRLDALPSCWPFLPPPPRTRRQQLLPSSLRVWMARAWREAGRARARHHSAGAPLRSWPPYVLPCSQRRRPTSSSPTPCGPPWQSCSTRGCRLPPHLYLPRRRRQLGPGLGPAAPPRPFALHRA